MAGHLGPPEWGGGCPMSEEARRGWWRSTPPHLSSVEVGCSGDAGGRIQGGQLRPLWLQGQAESPGSQRTVAGEASSLQGPGPPRASPDILLPNCRFLCPFLTSTDGPERIYFTAKGRVK